MSMFERSKNVTIHGGNFTIQKVDTIQRGFALLTSKASPLAFHLADADPFHSTCHLNTRTKILERIKSWAHRKTEKEAFVMWLQGAAGSGKSSIGRTIAQWCETEGILLGEFFFSQSDGTRDHIASLPATLAYRMATLTLPAAEESISLAIARNPHIFSASLAHQLRKLVLEPLNLEAPCGIVPHVIILDGLDECLSDVEQDLILEVICGTIYPLNPDLRILLCSRPEPVISTAFRGSSLQKISNSVSLSHAPDSDSDIRIFLVERFSNLKQHLSQLPDGEWPTTADITHLVAKSSGQFIFAATVVKYVSSPRHRNNAVARLRHVLDLKQLPSNTKQHPFAELDALYSLILATREEADITAKATAICLEYPKYFGAVSPADIAKVLQLELMTARAMLDEIASLFEITVDNHIKPFHASFEDFLFDRSRSGNFYCDRGDILAEITCGQLRQGRDPDVLPFHTLSLLLEEANPTEALQNVLNTAHPASIFSGNPFEGYEVPGVYYLIPVLRMLRKHVSSSADMNLMLYFDENFASHTTEIFDAMPSLQSVSSSSDFDTDSDGNPDPHLNRSKKSSVRQRPTCIRPRLLSLLSTSPSWDKVAMNFTRSNVEIRGMSEETLKSIRDEASFIRSHMPKTLSVLLGQHENRDAALYCLERMKDNLTKSLRMTFAELLPHSLSLVPWSAQVATAIEGLRNEEFYKQFPIEAQNAMNNYHLLRRSSPSHPSTSQPTLDVQNPQDERSPRTSHGSLKAMQDPVASSHLPSTASQGASGASKNSSAPSHKPAKSKRRKKRRK